MARTIIVGDVHGCFDELCALLDRVQLTVDDRLVSVGDLVDRGPRPHAVLDLFRTRPNTVTVMGNHERKHVRGIFSYSQEITRLQLGDRYADAVAWMRTLPYFYEDAHVRVVHAAMLPGVPLAEQSEALLCGSTSGARELRTNIADGPWHEHYTDAKPVVFGHHVTGDKPLTRDGRIFGLDTGACHGGYLTALVVPGFTVHAVKATQDHWATTKRRWQLPVLKTRPWLDYAWAELARETARPAAGDARGYLDAVAAWAADLRARMPDLVTKAHRSSADPHGARILYQARAGRLDLAAMERLCPTPGRLIAVAESLGVSTGAQP